MLYDDGDKEWLSFQSERVTWLKNEPPPAAEPIEEAMEEDAPEEQVGRVISYGTLCTLCTACGQNHSFGHCIKHPLLCSCCRGMHCPMRQFGACIIALQAEAVLLRCA